MGPLPQPHLAVAGAVTAGAVLCVSVLVVNTLGLVPTGLLVVLLAVMTGASASLLLWQRRCLANGVELQRLQRAIIESAPNAVVTSDGAGRVVACNPAAERLFGGNGGLIGKWMTDLIDVAETEPAGPAPRGNVLDRLGRKMVAEGRRADGKSFPVEIAVLRVGAGSTAMFAAYIRDLTEERKADAAHRAQQDRIHQNEKLNAMGSLLAGVAHELNNPLAILVTQATLLREKAATPDVERRAERIHAAAQRAGRIVRTFLAMARHKSPVRAATDINAAVEAAAEVVGYGLRSAGIELQFDLDRSLPPVEADRDLMGQVFAALLINAQQALAERPDQRSIAVRSHRAGAEVVVTVSDNGGGIPPEVRERIFEPYFTTKPVGAGTGIGLSVCRAIMADHGGRIELQPSTGAGAAFAISLPVMAAAAAPPPNAPAARGLNVLVIDDEPDVADSLAELLDVFGHRAVVMSSPAEAIARLKTERFDAVVTDLRMPGMNGVALHRAIRALDPRLADRTVIMTGDTVSGPGGAGSEAVEGSGLVLEKPFTAESVRAVLERVRN